MNGIHAGAVPLEDHQVDLLRALVEAHCSVHPREPFIFHDAMRAVPDAAISHSGLAPGSVTAIPADLHVLAHAGLIMFTHKDIFSVTPLGMRYYADVLQREGAPTERVEQTMRRYIESSGFKARFSAAYAKWAAAESLLWRSDVTPEQMTDVGHHCREAMQDFAAALIQFHQPPAYDPNPASATARLKAVIEHRRPALGKKVTDLLATLTAYWSAVFDLCNRQEHGAQKEGGRLGIDDARRVVFQTLNVMMEVDRALTM